MYGMSTDAGNHYIENHVVKPIVDGAKLYGWDSYALAESIYNHLYVAEDFFPELCDEDCFVAITVEDEINRRLSLTTS